MNAKHIIYVTMDGGLVQEILNLPPGFEVQVIDYDIEGESDEDRIQVSPINGEACCLTTYENSP
ncbi:MAG: hypothetical protein WCO56_26750 [Verrucomicrobiota bacterium]